MEYTVQQGDTIARVTKLLGTDWQTLKRLNPAAVGRSRANGNWFLREGKTVSGDRPFQTILAEQTKRQPVTQQQPTSAPKSITSPQSMSKAAAAVAQESGERWHTVQPGDTVWELAVKRYHVDPAEVMRLNDIEDPRQLKIGARLRLPAGEPEGERAVVASWYGEFHHGRPMANGQPFDMYGHTIAHKEMPLGTRVELVNPDTGEVARAVVADRGPYIQGRDVDLSYQLARQLSLVEQGIGNLIMRVL